VLHEIQPFHEDSGEYFGAICDIERKGSIEHKAIAYAIFNDLREKKNRLFILSLELRDAFGSILQDLIKKNLISIGATGKIVNLITNQYENSAIQMKTR
jgi:hypothetical protein